MTIRPPPCGPRPARTDPARRGRPGLKPTPTRGRTRTAADAPPPEPCASAAQSPRGPHLPAAADLGGGRGTEPVGCRTRRAAQSFGGERERGGNAAPQPSSRHSRELGAGPEGGATGGAGPGGRPSRAGSLAVVGRSRDVERDGGGALTV